MASKTEKKLEENHVKNIIKTIFNGKSHRPYLFALKTQDKLRAYIDLIEKIDKNNNKNTSDLFKSVYLDDATIDEKCWHLGIAKKTINDIYGSQSKDAKETANKIQEEANLKSLEMIRRKEEQAKQKILSLEAESIKKIRNVTSRIVIESSKTYIKENLDSKENFNLISKSSEKIKSTILK